MNRGTLVGVTGIPDCWIECVTGVRVPESYPLPYMINKAKPANTKDNLWYVLADADEPYMVDPKRKPRDNRSDVTIEFMNPKNNEVLGTCVIYGTLEKEFIYHPISEDMVLHSSLQRLAYAYLAKHVRYDDLRDLTELSLRIFRSRGDIFHNNISFSRDWEVWDDYKFPHVKPIEKKKGILLSIKKLCGGATS